jgi:hypothetical protein
MPATVAEGVELLDVADRKRSLCFDKGAQANLEGPVGQRIEGAEWQSDMRPGLIICDQDGRLIALDRHDRCGETDLDGRED